MGGIFAVIAIGMAFMIIRGEFPVFMWAAVGVLLLMDMIVISTILAARKPSNWLMKTDGKNLAIKFRSYLNGHFPAEDLTVVTLATDEIQSMCKTVERKNMPGSKNDGGSTSTDWSTWTYFDIKMNENADLNVLREATKHERLAEAPQEGKTRTSYHHRPVRVVGPDTIRLAWKSGRDKIQPKVGAVLKAFGDSISIGPENKIKQPHWHELEGDAFSDYLIDLCESGKGSKAERAARIHFNLDSKAAREFIEKLAG